MAPDTLEMAKYDDHPAVPLPVENPEHLASANSHTPGTGSTDEDDQSMVTSISEQDGGRDSTPEDPCCLEKTTVGSVITGNTGYDFIGLPRRNIRSVLEDSGPNWPQPCPQPLAEIWALPPATTIQHPTSFSNLSTTTLEATILKDKMSTITTTAWQTSFPPILPNSFNGNQPKAIRLFPLSNYTFGTKETQPEEDPSVLARLKRLEEHYEQHGMRRTCEGILVCHEHNHPHILMLQIANAFFKLPGDYLMPEDDEIEGFKSRLNERLAPVGTQFSGEGVNEEWEIGDTLAQWWRPNFETFMYPFIPAHVTRPKECKKLYFIQLPKQSELPHLFLKRSLTSLFRGSQCPKKHEASSCSSI